jgi:hypothetical protein
MENLAKILMNVKKTETTVIKCVSITTVHLIVNVEMDIVSNLMETRVKISMNVLNRSSLVPFWVRFVSTFQETIVVNVQMVLMKSMVLANCKLNLLYPLLQQQAVQTM